MSGSIQPTTHLSGLNISKPEWDGILSAAQKNNPEKIKRMVHEMNVDPNHSNVVGQSALHIAALWGNVSALEALIELGAKISPHNHLSGATPLHCAVQSTKPPLTNRIKCAELLIEAGAQIDAVDNYSPPRTAYDHWVDEDMGKFKFADSGVDENEYQLMLSILSGRGHAGDGVCTELHDAIKNKQFDEFDRIVNSYISSKDRAVEDQHLFTVVNAIDKSGKTPLHLAASKILDLLLWESGKDEKTNDENDEAFTANHLDSIEKNVAKYMEIVRKLFQCTTTLQEEGEFKDQSSDSKSSSSIIILQYSIERVLVNEFDFKDEKFSLYSVGALSELINCFIENCARSKLKTSLESDVQDFGQKLLSVMDRLVQSASKISPQKSFSAGCKNDVYIRILRLLESYGVKPVLPENSFYLHDACRRGNAVLVEYILRSTIVFDVNEQGRQGMRPLHMAARSGHTSVIKLLLGTNTAIQDSRKVDLAAKDNAGKTALDYASINSKEDIVLLLQDSIGEA
eukprot:CAMPEP_0194412332 /NCGR_PEP_ID=MMETSP0176-20130528/10786_1 /TAXON_ID=216777 /ORGANISM="Proboscia alata, Strain PI-D3" /LENGTH=512 /DNA_ID=CAMNT_0039215019 /DNA_START=151 /DNA_END=1689 /DNA_ORIENTATION=+